MASIGGLVLSEKKRFSRSFSSAPFQISKMKFFYLTRCEKSPLSKRTFFTMFQPKKVTFKCKKIVYGTLGDIKLDNLNNERSRRIYLS
jgi:hypothetical protein